MEELSCREAVLDALANRPQGLNGLEITEVISPSYSLFTVWVALTVLRMEGRVNYWEPNDFNNCVHNTYYLTARPGNMPIQRGDS